MTSGSAHQTGPQLEAMLPAGIRSRFVDNVNGLSMHVLEAGFESPGRPLVVLLHGFPELAYSWRRIMPDLAAAGFHVIAPDQRGYGRTTGWDDSYDGDLRSFRPLNLVRDMLGLVAAFGYRSAATVVGHDFGAMVAAFCALIRPDVFRSVALMSAPFAGTPTLAFDTIRRHGQGDLQADLASPTDINVALKALTPPRKHYQAYYSEPDANADMWHPPQGVHDFLRAYYHHKSADWIDNKPYPLTSWTAEELAKLPTYYVMELNKGMADTVATEMPSRDEIGSCAWLPDAELKVYSSEYRRTGFQGGLNWYRARRVPELSAELEIFSGRTIDVPSCFIAGQSDWGIYQRPGDFEQMQNTTCTQMHDCHLIAGAGHWVQQEKSDEVARLLTGFCLKTTSIACF
jgi:pimeloyl-ACP methyl ester carboxylesterase